MDVSAKMAKCFQSVIIFAKTQFQKSDRVSNKCYSNQKIAYMQVKTKKAKKSKINYATLLKSLKHSNTPTERA